MKKILLTALMLGALTQYVQPSSTVSLNAAICKYLEDNSQAIGKLNKSSLADLKPALTELFDNATPAEKAQYSVVIAELNKLDPAKVAAALGPLKKLVLALKTINKAAYDIIMKSLPKIIAMTLK